jgi:hypothetical protein
MHHRTIRRLAPLAALGALLIAAVAAPAATWHRLSPANQSNTAQLSLLRNADGSLTAVGLFKSATLGGSDVVKVPISAGGAVGAATVLASGANYGILENPAAILLNGVPTAVFGAQSTAGQDGLWTMDIGTGAPTYYAASGGGPTAAASGTSAGTTAAGGMAAWASTFGLGTLPLANVAAVPQSLPLTGCCAYNQAFATLANGSVFVVYDSNEDAASGRWFQQVDPATGGGVGTRARVPRSNVGANYDFPVESRASVAVVGNAAYTAWAQGYPSKTRIALWRRGTAAPKLWNPGYAVGVAGVAATRSGALWVYWTKASTGAVYAILSNNARTTWSTTKSLGRPSRGIETTYKLVGNADRSDRRLDLVASMARYVGDPTWYHVLASP